MVHRLLALHPDLGRRRGQDLAVADVGTLDEIGAEQPCGELVRQTFALRQADETVRVEGVGGPADAVASITEWICRARSTPPNFADR
jgi:hypothetical protein